LKSLGAHELIAKVEAAGFVFTVDGDSLKWRGPAGNLDDSDRAAIRASKPQIIALVALRTAAHDRATESGHIAVDREISRLWREAIEVCAPDVVTITGDVIPREMDAGAAYDRDAAKAEAERRYTTGEITLEQRNGLLAFAEQTELKLTRYDSSSQQKQAA
jgi:hypothetical protein